MDLLVRSNGWYASQSRKPQTPKNLAISLCLESAELLERFQWSETADTAAVATELADIVLFVAQIANIMELDLAASVAEKIKLNRLRTWKD
jgi:NTP pyrophosphatase (non-canonical NTP hydrolase)